MIKLPKTENKKQGEIFERGLKCWQEKGGGFPEAVENEL